MDEILWIGHQLTTSEQSTKRNKPDKPINPTQLTDYLSNSILIQNPSTQLNSNSENTLIVS